MRDVRHRGGVRSLRAVLAAVCLAVGVGVSGRAWGQAPVVMPSLPADAPVPGVAGAPGATGVTGATGLQTTADPAASSMAGKASKATVSAVSPVLPGMPGLPGAEVDRVVAIVNGDLVLDSDVAQEGRFAALLPYGEAGGKNTRNREIERLINRDLILQQARLQPGDEITDEAVQKDLASLKKSIPACKAMQCETKAGWDRFLATQGFTEASLDEQWKQRMEVLGFIEQRFRMGIKISDEQVKTYYEHDLKAQYDAQHATEPPLESISSRIQEVLLQQQVTLLLGDWLKSLRAQGSVVVLHPGEEAP